MQCDVQQAAGNNWRFFDVLADRIRCAGCDWEWVREGGMDGWMGKEEGGRKGGAESVVLRWRSGCGVLG